MDELMANIWKEHHNQLFHFINKRVKNPEDSEDILQDVFVKVISKIDGVKDISKLQSWIFQLTRNAIADYFRAKSKLNTQDEFVDVAEQDEINAMNEATGWIDYYVESLPAPYREALVMYEMKGMSQKDIAGQLGISYVNARSRVQRGRQMIKKNLTDCCVFNVDKYGNIIEYNRKTKDCSQCNN